jgi:hypothetical protein
MVGLREAHHRSEAVTEHGGALQSGAPLSVPEPERLEKQHMSKLTSISRKFRDARVSVVSQTGATLSTPAKGIEIILHTREGEAAPCCAEVDDLEGSGEHYAEIGLWFEGKTLVDSDGVFELPSQLVTWLRELGFTVEDED